MTIFSLMLSLILMMILMMNEDGNQNDSLSPEIVDDGQNSSLRRSSITRNPQRLQIFNEIQARYG
jgi:hypothetical protein